MHAELVELFRAETPAAAQRLFALLRDRKTPPAVVVRCCEVVFERALGRPQAAPDDPPGSSLLIQVVHESDVRTGDASHLQVAGEQAEP